MVYDLSGGNTGIVSPVISKMDSIPAGTITVTNPNNKNVYILGLLAVGAVWFFMKKKKRR